jgi:hypothetical protein
MTTPSVEIDKLLVSSENYTLYKMCAIINAVYDISKGKFVGAHQMATDSPAQVWYCDGKPGISDLVKPLLDAFPEPSDDPVNEPKIFKIFMPTDEQRRELDTLFTSGSCHFYVAWPSTGWPRRLIWEWNVKVNDLNLRTKAGREEKVQRTAHLQEEGKALFSQIQAAFTTEFIELVIAQEKQQRFEYDRLIPTGKKNARTISSDEYGILMRRMDRGGFYSHEPTMLKIWKTPSGIHHHIVIQEEGAAAVIPPTQ